MRGGYSAADWTTSLPTRNPTLLDGENLRRVLVVERTSTATALAARERRDHPGPRHAQVASECRRRPDLRLRRRHRRRQRTVTLRCVTFANSVAVGANGAGRLRWRGCRRRALRPRRGCDQPAPLVTLETCASPRNVADAGDNTGATGRGGYAHGGAIFIYFVDLFGTAIRFEGNHARGGAALASDAVAAGGSHGDGLGGAMSIEFGSYVDAHRRRRHRQPGQRRQRQLEPRRRGRLRRLRRRDPDRGQPDLALHVTSPRPTWSRTWPSAATARSGGLGRGGALPTTDAPVTLDRVLIIDNHSTGGDGATPAAGGCSSGRGAPGRGRRRRRLADPLRARDPDDCSCATASSPPTARAWARSVASRAAAAGASRSTASTPRCEHVTSPATPTDRRAACRARRWCCSPRRPRDDSRARLRNRGGPRGAGRRRRRSTRRPGGLRHLCPRPVRGQHYDTNSAVPAAPGTFSRLGDHDQRG